MGETTPPPDDHFPKVFSMTSATYQPAGARGGFAKQQQPKGDAKEEKENDTGESADGKANEATETKGDSAESDKASAADTAGATVKDEAVINEAAAAGAEERGGGAEGEQGCCEAIAIVAVICHWERFCVITSYCIRALLIGWHA